MSDFYGTRADLLPRTMVKVARAPEGESRLLKWIGRAGVHLLGFHEHLRYERASIQRFPQNRDGSIAWAEVARGLIIRSEEEGEHLVEDFVRENGGDLVIMWGSLALPSVLLNSAEALPRISEILETDALFWIFRTGFLLERNYFEGVVAIAHIPQS